MCGLKTASILLCCCVVFFDNVGLTTFACQNMSTVGTSQRRANRVPPACTPSLLAWLTWLLFTSLLTCRYWQLKSELCSMNRPLQSRVFSVANVVAVVSSLCWLFLLFFLLFHRLKLHDWGRLCDYRVATSDLSWNELGSHNGSHMFTKCSFHGRTFHFLHAISRKLSPRQ